MTYIPMLLADTAEMNPLVVAIIAIVAIALLVIISNFKIVPQGHATVVEWLVP